MFSKDWSALQQLIKGRELDSAERFVKQMHQSFQGQPLPHARIHLAWGRIAFLRQHYLNALGQWLVALVFAVPVSLWRKMLG